jgi:hypothetical protein
MGVIVTFDYTAWIARYPEFAQSGGTQPVTPAQAQAFFNEATMYLRNDGGGPVNTAAAQSTLMNMVTAHVAALNANLANGQPTSPLVGRISSANEGSVSVTVDFTPENAEQWFAQTKYGAAFWAATRAYRMMIYVPGPRARRIGGIGYPGAPGAIPGVGNIFTW